MIEIRANTQEEITEQFKKRSSELKRSVIEAVIDVLDGKEEFAVFVKLQPTGVALRVENCDFLLALKNNMDILIFEEDYETAAIARDWIDKLKTNSSLLK
jgi:protein-arginine kinase activator protein McsA